MANLVQNGTFTGATPASWVINNTTVTYTTGIFFGAQAIQTNVATSFTGTTPLAQSIDLTTFTAGQTMHIAYRIAATANAGGDGANFSVYLSTVNDITFPNTAPPYSYPISNLINVVNWTTELPSNGVFYLKEWTWSVTPEAKANGSIFLILKPDNGTFAGPLFTITDVYVSTDAFCYNEGTQILCVKESGEEEYRAIENIRVGHLVKTYKHGAKAVTHIGKGEMLNSHKNPKNCMYKLPKSGDMIDDLLVLGGHSILVDKYDSEEQEKESAAITNSKLEDKYLLVAKTSPLFTKMPEGEKYTYYHLALDNTGNDFVHYGIWANGVLSESCSEVVFKAHNLTPLE
jgi:hypothetical protein